MNVFNAIEIYFKIANFMVCVFYYSKKKLEITSVVLKSQFYLLFALCMDEQVW